MSPNMYTSLGGGTLHHPAFDGDISKFKSATLALLFRRTSSSSGSKGFTSRSQSKPPPPNMSSTVSRTWLMLAGMSCLDSKRFRKCEVRFLRSLGVVHSDSFLRGVLMTCLRGERSLEQRPTAASARASQWLGLIFHVSQEAVRWHLHVVNLTGQLSKI